MKPWNTPGEGWLINVPCATIAAPTGTSAAGAST
jgi:hypothetical protein